MPLAEGGRQGDLCRCLRISMKLATDSDLKPAISELTASCLSFLCSPGSFRATTVVPLVPHRGSLGIPSVARNVQTTVLPLRADQTAARQVP